MERCQVPGKRTPGNHTVETALRSKALFVALALATATWHTSPANEFPPFIAFPCEGSVKLADGSWYQRKTVAFNIGWMRDVFLDRGLMAQMKPASSRATAA
jgi:hypothetical protein